MARAQFARDFSNYLDPTGFIQLHRHVTGGPPGALISINTFVEPGSAYHEEGSASATAHNNSRSHSANHGVFKVDRFGDLNM
jgi:hypothetical protein